MHKCTNAQKKNATMCINAQMHKCTKEKCKMHKCTNAQMHKCTNAQMHKCTNAQMHKCITVQRKNAQMHKGNLYKCTNAPGRQGARAPGRQGARHKASIIFVGRKLRHLKYIYRTKQYCSDKSNLMIY